MSGSCRDQRGRPRSGKRAHDDKYVGTGEYKRSALRTERRGKIKDIKEQSI